MKLTAISLISLKADDSPAATEKIIGLCKSADEALWKLRDVKFDIRNASISRHAGYLLDERNIYCLPPNGSSSRIQRCRDRCLELWGMLTTEVADLQVAAKAEGVEIVSLSL
jgi:hypothetical protein